jgi:hypothetical protein
MRKGVVYWMIVFVVPFLFSCKKEVIKTNTNTVEVEPEPSLIGNWEGYYGSKTISSSGDTSYFEPLSGYSMILKPNGIAVVYNSLLEDTAIASMAYGTWVYSTNNKITVDYTYEPSFNVHYFIRANIDPNMHAINGKWYLFNWISGGLFYMAKK